MPNVSVVNSVIFHGCFVFLVFFIESIKCVIGSQSIEFYVFTNEIIICNDCFDLNYELECRYYGNVFLVITIDTPTFTPALTFISVLIGNESCKIGRIGRNVFAVISPTTIAAISIEYGLSQTQHASSHAANKPLDINPTNAAPGEFDDLEYIFGVLLIEDGFDYDINHFLNIGV